MRLRKSPHNAESCVNVTLTLYALRSCAIFLPGGKAAVVQYMILAKEMQKEA